VQRLRIWLANNLVAIGVAIILTVPALAALRDKVHAVQENRDLAPLPGRPETWAEAFKYSQQLDHWINDNFGFREKLIKLNNRIRFDLFRQFPTIQVIAGRNGRIFLSAHATFRPPFSAITTPCGYTMKDTDAVAAQLGDALSTLRRGGWDAKILIAPSSPVLYSDELPEWLEQRCEASAAPIPAILASPRLGSDDRKLVFYPLAEMRELKRSMDVFPKTWFHWYGAGPRAVAGLSVDHFWNISPSTGTTLAASSRVVPSDISHMFPGVRLTSEVLVADYPASGVQACRGSACFPDLTEVARKLDEVQTFRNASAPFGKLLILSDSFGEFIAGWYSRYFREVTHITTNRLTELDDAQHEEFRQFLRRELQDSRLLFVYHDGSIIDDRLSHDLLMLVH
jgi:hypothetical protein